MGSARLDVARDGRAARRGARAAMGERRPRERCPHDPTQCQPVGRRHDDQGHEDPPDSPDRPGRRDRRPSDRASRGGHHAMCRARRPVRRPAVRLLLPTGSLPPVQPERRQPPLRAHGRQARHPHAPARHASLQRDRTARVGRRPADGGRTAGARRWWRDHPQGLRRLGRPRRSAGVGADWLPGCRARGRRRW